MVPCVAQSRNTFKGFSTHLPESRVVFAFDNLERSHARESLGFDAHDLTRTLDRRMNFGELFGVVESTVESPIPRNHHRG